MTRAWRSPAHLDPSRYLGSDGVVDHDDPLVRALALELGAGLDDDEAVARAAFGWVRDEIAHPFDIDDPRVTLTASQVLRERVGLCYAQAHLLTALLRASGVPTGLCYQQLPDGDGGSVLHGLVAVHLRGRWHRQDPRGDRADLWSEFSLDGERLPYGPCDRATDLPGVHVAPAPAVVRALTSCEDVRSCPLPADLDEL